MTFFEVAAAAFVLAASYESSKWFFDRYVTNRYRWKCPHCNFRMKTNNKETWHLIQATIHNHECEHAS